MGFKAKKFVHVFSTANYARQLSSALLSALLLAACGGGSSGGGASGAAPAPAPGSVPVVASTPLPDYIESGGLKGALGVHDPVMIKGGDTYYVMGTGTGIKTSKDMVTWKSAGAAFGDGFKFDWWSRDIPRAPRSGLPTSPIAMANTGCTTRYRPG